MDTSDNSGYGMVYSYDVRYIRDRVLCDLFFGVGVVLDRCKGRGNLVTIRETYDFLYSVRHIESEMRKLSAKRDALKYCLLPAGIRYDLDRVSTSPKDRFSEIEAEIADISTEIALLNEQKYNAIKSVSLAITRLESDKEQEILMRIYVGHQSVNKIAVELGYSKSAVYKIRGQGVSKLAKIMSHKRV